MGEGLLIKSHMTPRQLHHQSPHPSLVNTSQSWEPAAQHTALSTAQHDEEGHLLVPQLL